MKDEAEIHWRYRNRFNKEYGEGRRFNSKENDRGGIQDEKRSWRSCLAPRLLESLE